MLLKKLRFTTEIWLFENDKAENVCAGDNSKCRTRNYWQKVLRSLQ